MSGRRPPDFDEPLREQLAHLRLLKRAATAANQCATLEEAAGIVLEEVCAFTGWPVGHLYVPASGGEVLVSSGTWYLSDPEQYAALYRVTEALPLPAGTGLPGRILATGRAAWVPDIGADENFPRAAMALDLGLRAASGFPVLVGDEVAAVLEFFAEKAIQPDQALLDLMSGVGHQLARVVERARATAALRDSEERYRAVTQSARDAIITADAEGRILSFNTGAERTFGYSEAEVAAKPLTVLMPQRLHRPHEVAIARLRRGGSPRLLGQQVELAGLRRDGTEFPLEVSLSTWTTSAGTFYTGIIRDISDRRDAEQERERFEQQLAQRALHDELTALPNRALLLDRLERAVARSVRTDTSVTVLSVNLDRFKAVNDTYGHTSGDQLLVAAAGRLQAVQGPDDTVARIGGDEFGVLCEDVDGSEEAVRIAERISAAFANPFEIGGQDVAVTVTVGVAIGRAGTSAADQLLRNAVVATEQARQKGPGNWSLYDESMRADAAARRSVEQELRNAIRNNQLRLYYQPIVDVASGTVAGVEALVRWEHPTRGLLFPQQFIALAEESGLILPLGQWVLEEACRQAAAWQRAAPGLNGLRMSINVSARQFQQPHWVDDVASALLASGCPPGQLVLEITESVLMEDTDKTARRLGELRHLGVRIAIDDFGTGYSSLGYLRQFAVDILKVDKSFIDGVAEGPHESALARAVIKLAGTLHLDAVAEGVTTRKQLAALRRLRCRFAQGYYFARPQPGEGIGTLLARPGVTPPDVNGGDLAPLAAS